MSGIGSMIGGMFWTQGPDGEFAPVEHCLQVTCGQDFESFVRSKQHGVGPFPYSHYSPVFETYTNLWKDRTMKILFVPNSHGSRSCCWVNARVVKWNEYNMGPGDCRLKWRLYAKLENKPETETLQVGAVAKLHGLRSSPEHNSKLVIIITKKDPTPEGEDRFAVLCCNGESGGKTMVVKQSNLVLYRNCDNNNTDCDTEVQFAVNRSNVQGGGTLRIELENNSLGLLSFQWLEPVPEDTVKWYIEPAAAAAGSTNFNLDEFGEPIDRQEMIRLRRENYNELERMYASGELQAFMEQKLQTIQDYGCNLVAIRKILLSLPFGIVCLLVVDHILPQATDAALVELICSTAVQSGSDKESIARSFLLEANSHQSSSSCHIRQQVEGLSSEEAIAQYPWGIDYLELNVQTKVACELQRKVGEWYESRGDFRCAIIHYKKMVERLESISAESGKLSTLANALSDLGLAYKRLGRLDLASKYYDISLTMKSTRDSRIHNKERLEQEMEEWTGTSGTITPWNCFQDDADDFCVPQICCACGKTASKKCQGCVLVCYCNQTCQKKNWKSHKAICRSRSSSTAS